jgi:hypothetical protein
MKDVTIELFIKRWIKQLDIIGQAEINSPEAASMIMNVCWQVLGSCKKQKGVQKDVTRIISKVKFNLLTCLDKNRLGVRFLKLKIETG